MNTLQKKLAAVGAALLVLLGIALVLLWVNSPDRVLKSFLNTIAEEGYYEAAENGELDLDEVLVAEHPAFANFVSDTITADKKKNIRWFLSDWLFAENFDYDITSETAWRSRVKTEEVNGEKVPVINEHGNETVEQDPISRHVAHHYEAYVDVTFDEIPDPVIIKLIRNTDESWSPLSQLFRGWKVTRIRYQELSEDELLEFDFGDDEFFDLDELEEGELEFEFDDEGNLVPVDELEDTIDAEEDLEEAE